VLQLGDDTLTARLQLPLRLSLRATHHAHFHDLQGAGHVIWGGPIFANVDDSEEQSTRATTDGNSVVASKPFIGSALIAQGKNLQSVMEILAKDEYVQKGVWDMEAAGVWELD